MRTRRGGHIRGGRGGVHVSGPSAVNTQATVPSSDFSPEGASAPPTPAACRGMSPASVSESSANCSVCSGGHLSNAGHAHAAHHEGGYGSTRAALSPGSAVGLRGTCRTGRRMMERSALTVRDPQGRQSRDSCRSPPASLRPGVVPGEVAIDFHPGVTWQVPDEASKLRHWAGGGQSLAHSDPRDQTVPCHVGLGFPHTAYVIGRPTDRPCAPAPSVPPGPPSGPAPCVFAAYVLVNSPNYIYRD